VPCLDENTLAALADGALAEPARAAVEAHMDECRACGDLAAEFARSLVSHAPGARPARPWLQIGDPVGRYRVERFLASGGMGQLYVASDPTLGRLVALKLVRADLGRDGAAGLLVEAQAMARVSHANVVAVHDVGALGAETFIAMELVEGETLASWQLVARSWREVVAAYLQAGRGLQAAHAAEIVHGDFKPANALIRPDGRVQVTDFGLARAELDAGQEPVAGGDALLRTTTARGMLGTPAYMAPEQFRGERAGKPGDQFAFCVACWEALYGERPFAGDELEELAANVTAGRRRPPPAGAAVPARLRRILERGLSADPADRHRSMDELVAALERLRLSPSRRPAIALTAAAAAVIALAAAAAYGATRGDEADAACEHAARRAAAVWNPEARAALRAAFLATETVYGEAAARTLEQRFDRQAALFTREHRQTCLEPPRTSDAAALVAERRACLDAGLLELEAMRDRLLAGGEEVLDAAVRAAFGLADLRLCAEVRDQVGRARLPEDAVIAARIAALRRRKAELDAAWRTGGAAAVVGELEALAAQAAATGYRPLEADTFSALSLVQVNLERWDQARDSAHRSLQAAQAIGSGSMVARSAIRLAQIVGRDPARADEALQWADLGDSAIESLGGELAAPELRAALASARGQIFQQRGDYDGALAQFEERARHERAAHGDDVHHHLAATDQELGATLYRLGRFAEAATATERAISSNEQIFGDRHFSLVTPLTQLGAARERLGDLDGAIAAHRRAGELSATAYGAENLRLAAVHNNLALVLERKGELAEAASLLGKAADIYRAAGSLDRLGIALLNLAGIESSMGRQDVAVARGLEALELLEQVFGPEHSHLGSALTVVGDALCDRGDCAAALPYFERSLAIRESTLGREHPSLAFSLFGLARVHGAAGEHRRAIPLLERALAVATPSARPATGLALAKAIWQGRRDRRRASAVARAALEGADDELRGRIETWLAEVER
jgi:eukaryotic-like serine/threonine-protein kinase